METLSGHSPWFPFVSVDPEKLGGEPVLRGTRVPVQALFDYLKEGHDLAAFLDHFRGVTREQVEALLELSARAVADELSGTNNSREWRTSVGAISDADAAEMNRVVNEAFGRVEERERSEGG